jgi:hypothetical protein
MIIAAIVIGLALALFCALPWAVGRAVAKLWDTINRP